MLLHSSHGDYEKKLTTAQQLSKHLFEKYEYEETFPLLNVGCLSELLWIHN